ncbi:MAG: carboxymuconolactone decarboxylase family protein [Clostridiaceae bacterium]|nr:carboxymuconolactone decarboxylase family protein [Clostridiaceae bacterium]
MVKDLLKATNQNNVKIAKALPDEMGGFMMMHNAALENGALDPKTKELIALGISISVRCEPCIVSHMESLIALDVTREEIEETIAVALFMGGGPSLVYGGKALAAFDELKK